jgi:hypothetical protein
MSDENEWIPSKAAAEIAGIPQPNLHYYASIGDVASKSGGRRGKLYNREDVLKVRRLLATKGKKAPPQEKVLIDWVVAKDVPTALKLSMEVYSEDIDLREAALYASWRKNNDKITIGAFNADRSEVYATIQMVPLPEHIIADVLTGRREEASIRPDDIEAYDRPGAYTLLCTSVTALKSRPLLLYELLYRYTQFWLEQYPTRWIKRIYAQTVSESGMLLAQHMFMAPRPDLHFDSFMLDLQYPPAAKIIRQFKEQLAEKAPLPPDLQWPPIAPEKPATVLAPVKTQRNTTWSQERITANESAPSDMPDGLIGLADYAKQKGIPESTLKKAAATGRIPVERGEWKKGRATIKTALDAEGRAKVDELYGQVNQSMDPLFPAAVPPAGGNE